MFVSRDASHGLYECGPRLSLLCKHTSPSSRYRVEPATPLGGLFDPAALDPSTLLLDARMNCRTIRNSEN
jgi:hypothetical protein